MSHVGDLDILERIQKLINLGLGDTGRLLFIRDSLKKQKLLYNSDEKYLEALLDSSKVKEHLNPDDSSNLIASIESLIQSRIGDSPRLHHIRDTIVGRKKLYNSDKKYLQDKLEHYPIRKPKSRLKKNEILDEPPINKLQSQLVKANEKFSEFEKIKENPIITKMNLKEKISTDDIESILQGVNPSKINQKNSNEIKTEKMEPENEKIEKPKKLISHIDFQEEKLSQLVKSRDEFEQKVSLQKQRIKDKTENNQHSISYHSTLSDSALKPSKFSDSQNKKSPKKSNLIKKNISKKVKRNKKKASKRKKT